MLILDVGCGNVLRGDLGLDSSQHSIDKHGGKVKYCLLGFDSFPFMSDEFDRVIAHHSLEHVPGNIYYKNYGDWYQKYPLVDLFNEVYRVLKHNGEFEIWVPSANSDGFKSDVTHQSSWTLNTINYFSGDYFHCYEMLGHSSNFKLLLAEEIDGNQISHFIVKANKEEKWKLE